MIDTLQQRLEAALSNPDQPATTSAIAGTRAKAKRHPMTTREQNLEAVLRRYAQFGADLIADGTVYQNGLPFATQELYDAWMEIQGEREAVLGESVSEVPKVAATNCSANFLREGVRLWWKGSDTKWHFTKKDAYRIQLIADELSAHTATITKLEAENAELNRALESIPVGRRLTTACARCGEQVTACESELTENLQTVCDKCLLANCPEEGLATEYDTYGYSHHEQCNCGLCCALGKMESLAKSAAPSPAPAPESEQSDGK